MESETGRNVLFATPKLEEQFRNLVTSDKEVGGFLVVKYGDPLVGKIKDYRPISGYPMFIESWIVVPNESQQPENSWLTRDFALVNDVARATAQSLHGWSTVIHFHTHPSGDATPSKQDMSFVMKTMLRSRNGVANSAIVSIHPMQVVTYWWTARDKSLEAKSDGYVSWRSKAMKNLWKSLTG